VTVVGIVKDMSYAPGAARSPNVYLPAAYWLPENVTLVARVHGQTAAYVAICRDALQQVDAKAPVFSAKTLDERLEEVLARPRFYTTVVLFFGAFAMLLALIGMYGVATFLVVQRTHEIGVRLAVGASPERLRAALFRQSLAPVVLGIVLGVWGAVELGQLVQGLIATADPIGGAASAAGVVLLATAAVAIWTATKRVVRVDPIRVLRSE
jgi:putative ABC transport system permease protein